MNENKLMMEGFVELKTEEFSICGGIKPDTIRKIAKCIAIIMEFLNSYGEDFMKGYRKGLEGQPLLKSSLR